MALNWSVTKIKYFQDNPEELYFTYSKGSPDEYEDLNPITKALVFGSMIVGIGDLNYKTAPDFYARWKFHEDVDKLYLCERYQDNNWTKEYLTPEIMLRHLGLGTNVAFLNDKNWISKTLESLKRTGDDKEMNAKAIKTFLDEKKTEFENSLLAVIS